MKALTNREMIRGCKQEEGLQVLKQLFRRLMSIKFGETRQVFR